MALENKKTTRGVSRVIWAAGVIPVNMLRGEACFGKEGKPFFETEGCDASTCMVILVGQSFLHGTNPIAFLQVHLLPFRQIFFKNLLDDAATARTVEGLKLEGRTVVAEKIRRRNEKLQDKVAFSMEICLATVQTAENCLFAAEEVQGIVGDEDGFEWLAEGGDQHIHAEKRTMGVSVLCRQLQHRHGYVDAGHWSVFLRQPAGNPAGAATHFENRAVLGEHLLIENTVFQEFFHLQGVKTGGKVFRQRLEDITRFVLIIPVNCYHRGTFDADLKVQEAGFRRGSRVAIYMNQPVVAGIQVNQLEG